MTEKVTQKDVYELVNSRFDRLEDKFDEKFVNHEERINKLEDLGSKVVGIFAIINIIATAAFSWIWNKMNGSI